MTSNNNRKNNKMETIELNGKKYAEILETKDSTTGAPQVGQKVFIRTITYHHVGVITAVTDKWLTLEKASWVADSGRWSDAIKKGTLNEVEFEGSTTIHVESIVDITPWNHPLPTATK
jgi:hypothetical protein